MAKPRRYPMPLAVEWVGHELIDIASDHTNTIAVQMNSKAIPLNTDGAESSNVRTVLSAAQTHWLIKNLF